MARTTISNIVEDLTQFSRRKKEENANLFCEGNEHLKKLLLKLWDNGIQTYACCAGHKDEENLNNDCYMVSNNPYIYFEIKNLTEMQQQKLYNHLIMNCKKLGVVSSFQLSIDNYMGFEKHGLSIHLKYDKDCFKILNDIFEDVFNEKTIFNKLKKLLKSEQKQESLTAEELEFIDSLLLINSIEFMNVIIPNTVNDLIDVKNINGEIYFKFDTGLYRFEDKSYYRRVNNSYHDDPEYEYYVKIPDTEEYRRITDDDLDIVDGTKSFKSGVNYYYIDNDTSTLEEIVARDGAKMSDVIEVDKYDKTSTRLPDNRLVDCYEKNNSESYIIFKSIETNESPSKPYIYQNYYTEVDTTQPIDDSVTYYEGVSKIEKPAGTLTEWKKIYKQISTGGETSDPNIEYFTRNDTNQY